MKKFLLTLLFTVYSVITFGYTFDNGLTLDASAGVVANYVYRGEKITGFAVQPNITFGYYDDYNNSICINAWASFGDFANVSWEKPIYKELDLSIEYSYNEQFTIGLTHFYYFDGSHYFDMSDGYNGNTTQLEIYLELCLSENIPLTLYWATLLAGADYGEPYEHPCKDRPYSTYVEISYPIDFGNGYELTPRVGFSPWKSYYTQFDENFTFNNLQLTFNKTFEFPTMGYCSLYAEMMFNLHGVGRTKFTYNQNWFWNVGLSIGI